jgi:uncharacterized protein YeaO (DUF488 family)
MLGRYQMRRGARAAELPAGSRQDTRKHTRHPLRPTEEMVAAYLAEPSDAAFERFRDAYQAEVRGRFAADEGAFLALAEAAGRGPVHLGCSCPTRRNPDVRRCHTWLALELMEELFPALDVRFPPSGP